MKKKIILAVALGCLTTSMVAQDAHNESDKNHRTESRSDYRNCLKLGVKIGFNYSNVVNAQGDALKTTAKFGMVGGGFFGLPINKYLGIDI